MLFRPVEKQVICDSAIPHNASVHMGKDISSNIQHFDQHEHQYVSSSPSISSRKPAHEIEQEQRMPWKRVNGSLKNLSRAFNLSLVYHTFQGLRHPVGRGFHEPTKVAIRQSRLIALLRSLIHLIPFTFAVFEIVLNWNVYYVGTKHYNAAVYQVIAKAHEILIQSSIAAMVFSAIRRELVLGKGLPFGLLFGGLQVSQVSYLWSVELWGAMKAQYLCPSRK